MQDQIITYGSAIIGSLIFAFTDSHWFNAVEAEVYAMSTLTTAIVTWLILHWLEHSEDSGNERYILMISYILGLATGIHLLNLLALPFMGMIIYFRKTNFSWSSFTAMSGITGVIFITVYLGIIKGFPQIAAKIGLTGLALVVFILFCSTIYSVIKEKRLVSLVLSSAILVIVVYYNYAVSYKHLTLPTILLE